MKSNFQNLNKKISDSIEKNVSFILDRQKDDLDVNMKTIDLSNIENIMRTLKSKP